VYDNIIKAEKRDRGSFSDSNVAKINDHAFYCGLPSDTRTLVEKRNDLSPIEMYD